mmetsp:Transcript_5596/g.4806  ORF Transcript_5596/g.4806 Transcript_5596/m.4806 type:complete len:86 (+) Transcript_5596:361-618(+)
MSTVEPFRKTQTRISGRIKDHVSNQSTWEDAMDRNFDNITILVREKKVLKENNLLKRHHLTEVLDGMDDATKHSNMVKEEITSIK